MEYPRLELMVATDNNLGIGKDNKLPWKIPSEFAYYRRMTSSAIDSKKVHASIYATKNWHSLPETCKPWGNTICFILSRSIRQEDVSKYGQDVYVHSTWKAIIDHLCQPEIRERVDRIWVHGGVITYTEALRSPHFYRLYITRIEANFPADVFFPKFDESRMCLVHDPDVPQGIQHDADVDYQIFVYETIGLNPLLES